MADILNVSVADNKYTVIVREDHSREVLRYGEPWARYADGVDNLTIALAEEVQRLRGLPESTVKSKEEADWKEYNEWQHAQRS